MNTPANYDSSSAVAIVGLGIRVPGANDPDTYWEMILEGREAIKRYDRQDLIEAGVAPSIVDDPNYVSACGHLEDADAFDAAFFGIPRSEARMMDPQHRIFLETSYTALDNAGLVADEVVRRTGLFGGCFMNKYLPLNLYANREFMGSPLSTFARNYNDKDFLCGRVAHLLDLQGPVVTVQSACSTSLVAVHLACQSLLTYECDAALAGGAAINLPYPGGYLAPDATMFSPEGRCRTFDSATTGTLPGNGAVIVALRRLTDALEAGHYIHAVIVGSAVNNDGSNKASFTAPNVSAQRDVILQAQTMADIDVSSVGYVEAHGTGTRLGDPIEVAALTEAFAQSTQSKQFCALGSIKANIGHLDAGAGTAGLVRAALCLNKQVIPPVANFTSPNPELCLDTSPFYVPTDAKPWPRGSAPRYAGVSSFGVGGTNAHVVLAEPPMPASPVRVPATDIVFPVSGKTKEAVVRNAAGVAAKLLRSDPTDAADIAFTLTSKRPEFEYRAMVTATTVSEASDKLAKLAPLDVQEKSHSKVVFMFPGVGTQYPDMARTLYLTDDEFAADIDRAAEVVKPHLGFDLRSFMYPNDFPALDVDSHAVPNVVCAVFAVSYSLARFWQRAGIEPAAMLGHSLGEYVAATIAGVLSLEDGLTLTVKRGQFFDAIPQGRMMVTPMASDRLQEILPDNISLGAINGPELSLVSGLLTDLERLREQLKQDHDLACRILPIRMASHSHLVDDFRESFLEELRNFTFNPPKVPYLSCLTGDWIVPAQATDPHYWADQLRNPVQFSKMIGKLSADENVLLEVGPGTTLTTLARIQRKTSTRYAVSTLPHPEETVSERQRLVETAGRLWTLGVPVGLGQLLPGDARMTSLPGYAFARDKHWVAPDIVIGPGAEFDGSPEIRRSPKSSSPSEHKKECKTNTRRWSALQNRIALVWEEILGTSVSSLDDDFDKLGGHSMLAAQVLAKLKSDVDASLDIEDIYRAPTVRQLAALIDHRKSGVIDVRLDLRKEPHLVEQVRPEPDLLPAEPGLPFLLTGATGFLGSFILDQLITQTKAQVHVLVRAKTEAKAFQRIVHAAQQYGLPTPPKSRIVVEIGDLERADLGFSKATFARLSNQLGGVIHCGAFVNFARPYEVLKQANVSSLAPIFQICGRTRLKPLHFVSTIFVNMGAITSQKDYVTETESLSEPIGHDTGYTESKWVAEKTCEIARERGFPVAIYRPGNILGATTNGAANLDDYLCRVVTGSVELGASPLRSYPLPFGAVDDVAGTIVALASSAGQHNETYHVIQPEPLPWNSLFNGLTDVDLPIEAVTWDKWCARLAAALDQQSIEDLSPLANMLEAPSDRQMPRFDTQLLTEARYQVGRPFPQLGPDYIARMLCWVRDKKNLQSCNCPN